MDTMKILIVCSPAGDIMMVSPCFMGGTSDSMTVLKSYLLPCLEKGDDLLADKGRQELMIIQYLHI